MTPIHTRRCTAQALVLTLTLALAIYAAPASARTAGACPATCQSAPSTGGGARGSDLESAYYTIGGAAVALPLIGLVIARIAERNRRRRVRQPPPRPPSLTPKQRTTKEQTC
jgi:hypothetical protein